METKFKIAKYIKNNDVFEKTGFDEYNITYLKGNKVHQLRIVVNGYLTKQTINLISFKDGYKNNILLGIKEYIDNIDNIKNITNKKITLSYIKQFYSKTLVKNVQNYLININKEESRDKLTKFGLI